MNILRTRRQQVAAFMVLWLVFTVGASLVIFTAIVSSDDKGDTLDGVDSEVLSALSSPTPIPALGTPTPAATPTELPILARGQPFSLGLHVQATQPTVDETVMVGYMDSVKNQLNVDWVRVQMRWDLIETQPGVFNWANWDLVFRLAVENDVQVMATIIGAPLWARPPQADPSVLAPPQDFNDYARFVVAVLRRYQNQLRAVEIWNGMNILSNWGDRPSVNAASYVDLLRVTHAAVQDINPDVLIISGAPQPSPLLQEGENILTQDDFIYMDEMIAVGLLEVVNCVGVQHNGYNISPNTAWDAVPTNPTAIFRGPFDNPHHSWSFFSTVNTYARKIAIQGSDIPLCVTDFGWPSSEDLPETPINLAFAQDNSLDEQAEWIRDSIDLMQTWGFVRLAFLSNLNVGPESGFNPQVEGVAYSLIRPDYAISPAWQAIADRVTADISR